MVLTPYHFKEALMHFNIACPVKKKKPISNLKSRIKLDKLRNSVL